MNGPNKRIVLFGLFGSGNFGNDGSLEAMLRLLRKERPSVELACICSGPDRVQHEYQILALPINRLRPSGTVFRSIDRLLFAVPGKLLDLIHTFKSVRKFDALIVPGTGILDDFGDRPGGMPYALFRTFLAAKLYDTKILLVSIGAGPIHNPVNRWIMKSAAKLADYRSYRDATSKRFMDSIGIDTSCDPVYPDIAFKLPENQPSGINVSDGSRFTVGLGVMNYCGWYGNTDAAAVIYATYLKKLSKFAVWALEHGYRVRLLSGDTADQSAVEDLVEAVKDQRGACVRNVVVEPAHSLHDVMRQLADVDILVATRFHNVICALKMGKPVISIGYSDKNDTLMADMGLGDFCQHVEQLDVVLLIDQFTKLLAGRAKHESNIRERISNYQQRLIHQDSMLLSTFL